MKFKLLEVALYVDNLDEAEHFYSNKLGLEIKGKKENRHLFYKIGDQMLLIFNPKLTKIKSGLSPVHGSSGQGHVAFEISSDQYNVYRDFLIKNNIGIEDEVVWPQGGKSIYFRDPSGNSLEFVTRNVWTN